MAIDISNTTRRIVYTGSAGTGPYAFAFEVLVNTDVAVFFNNTELTLTTDYTVSISANGTGSVTIVVGTNVPTTPDANDRITIIGDRAIQRTTDFTTGGPLFATSLNDELDSLTIFTQQNLEQSNRSLRAPNTDPTTVSMELPINTTRANKYLTFDANGNPAALNSVGTYRGDWAASTDYVLQDIVKDTTTNNIFIVITAHTSSGSLPITTNADSAKWALIVDAASATNSATAAQTAQTAAETAETNAETAETNAETAETNAETAQAAAETAQTAAETAQAAAETAETNAETAETGAVNAKNSAEAIFDNFDDAYLGSKTSDPTVDNDGDALQDGALYYNTTDNIVKVYDLASTSWLQLTPTVANQNNINTVAGISADVTTVAGIDSDVTTVSGISSDVTSVSGNETNINAVNANSANINNVATNSANINTVAGIDNDITVVAADGTDIGAVAAIASNVNTVAGIESNITTVAGISSDVTTVASDTTDIGAVASDISNVNIVAGNTTNINTVAGVSANVTTVATDIANVNTVATNISPVNLFGEQYLGVQSSAPVTTTTGALYYDSGDEQLYIWDGSVWQQAAFSASGTVISFNTREGAVTLSSSDVTTALGFTPYNAATPGSIATQDANAVNITGGTIVGMPSPTVGNAVSTKDYVDAAVAGLKWKTAVQLHADSNIALTGTTGTLVIDGHAALVTADDGYRLLLTGQSTDSEKGIYVYNDDGANYTLNRSTDADVYTELEGATVFVQEGTAYEATGWTENNYDLTDFTGQTWVQFAGAGTYAAGSGLTLTGNTFAVDTTVLLSGAIGTSVQAYDAGLDDISALTPTDSNIIVGDGANWVAESGATARTSLGLGALATLGTVDTAQIDNNAITSDKIAANAVGTDEIGPSNLVDIAGLGTTDSNFIVSNGTNYVAETGATARTSMGLGTGNDVQFDSFGVGTAASGTTGEIRATNNITAYYSDDRLKTRHGNIENALEKVMILNGFHYEANAVANDLGYESKPEVGVSAQEVQSVLPEIVVPAPIDDKYLTVHYEKLVPLLIEAIKELKQEIDNLKG